MICHFRFKNSTQVGTLNYIFIKQDTNSRINYWISSTENQLQHNEITLGMGVSVNLLTG